jgi:DNA-binding IclR family transcriptional regulator
VKPILRSNKSAARTVDILVLIAAAKKPLTITEISSSLEIPKSSTFEILYTLVEKGFLEIDNEELKTFKLGVKIFEVGTAFLSKTDLHGAARPFIEDLMLKCGETVFMAVEDKGSIVYLDKAEGHTNVRTTCVIGARNLMHVTGLGKALLATYPVEKVREITGGGALIARTEMTITHFNDLVKDLEEIRKRGYSIDDREGVEDLYCLAAPIYNRLNRSVAAISVASLYSKMTDEKHEKIRKLITETALNISRRLGFIGDKLYFD